MTLKQKAWRDPRLAEGPTGGPLIAGHGTWHLLGSVGSRQFGTVSGMPGFEGREFELIDDGPVVQLDDGSYYLDYNTNEPWRVVEDQYGQEQVESIAKFRRLQPWSAGYFEKLTRPKAPAKAKDAMPVDGLTGLAFLGGRAPTVQNIVARLAREGLTVSRGANGELLVSTPGGRWPKDALVHDVLRRPGMLAYLGGDLPCAWPHDAETPLAQTLDVIGNGLCSADAHRVKPATGILGKLKAALA